MVKINLNIKSKFIVNGKEYKSVEEMPDTIRQAYERVRESRSDALHIEGAARSTTRITFNGQEYDSPDAMPPDIRQTYDHVMESLLKGKVPPELTSLIQGNGVLSGYGMEEHRTAEGPKPMVFESAFPTSKRWLIVGLLLLMVLGSLFYVLSTSGSR
jgi:hypothetical protein